MSSTQEALGSELDAVRETLFSAERETPRKVIAFQADVTPQFIGYVIAGTKHLSLAAFLRLWKAGAPRPLTDRLARLLERLNTDYRITRRTVMDAADPVAHACSSIRDGVDFFEAVRGSHADGVVDGAELSDIEQRAAAMKEQLDAIVGGCRRAAEKK